MRKIYIEELKKLELNILDFFVQICEENGLTYFLAGGTLLGAVRHQGFIPWDDDIDVMMPRKDYEKLKEIFPNHSYYHFFYYGNTPNYPKPFGTINDCRTCKPELNIREKCRHILGVNIDIFPIDEIPESPKEIHQYYSDLSKMAKKMYCITYSYTYKKSYWFTLKKYAGITLYRLLEMLKITSVDRIVQEYDKLAQKYTGTGSRMCGVTTIDNYGEKEASVAKEYFPIIKMKYEGRDCNVPNNFDKYLKGLYGNYMKLPPLEKQITHHVSEYYWKE